MAQGVAARLRPYAQPVRLHSYRDLGEEAAGRRVDGVDDIVVAPGYPEHRSVGGNVAHVRAASARDPPGGDGLPGRKADHGDRAVATVRYVEKATVATGVQAMGVRAGGDEPGHPEGRGVDQPDPGVVLVGDVEDAPGRVELDVLRRRARQVQVIHHRQRVQIDADQPAAELAGGDQIGTGGREVDVIHARAVDVNPVLEGEGMRVTEIEILAGFGHHDGVAPVGCEVHVVRIVHRDVRPGGPTGHGVDRSEAVAQVVRHVQRAHV